MCAPMIPNKTLLLTRVGINQVLRSISRSRYGRDPGCLQKIIKRVPSRHNFSLKAAASDKFVKLREVYDALSNEETRRFYDRTLAQEAASREMRMKLEIPYEKDVKNWESIPNMVDCLGGRNMELGYQATRALGTDIVIIIFSICGIKYAIYLFLKEKKGRTMLIKNSLEPCIINVMYL